MIEKVLHPKNLYKACHQVVSNKGAAGIDGMQVNELKSFIDDNRIPVVTSILNRKYVPQTIKGVEIPKSKGKTRLLGVPTVADRWLQQGAYAKASAPACGKPAIGDQIRTRIRRRELWLPPGKEPSWGSKTIPEK